MIYQLMRRIIGRGGFDREAVLEMLQVYRTFGRITEEEFTELLLAAGGGGEG